MVLRQVLCRALHSGRQWRPSAKGLGRGPARAAQIDLRVAAAKPARYDPGHHRSGVPVASRSLSGSGQATNSSSRTVLQQGQKAKPGVIVDLRELKDKSVSIASVLERAVESARVPLYLMAIDDATGKRYALCDTVPAESQALRFLAFHDDEQAKQALWWTTGFLLGAAVQDSLHSDAITSRDILITTPTQMVDGGGFAIQFLVKDVNESLAAVAPSDDEAILNSCISLISKGLDASQKIRREIKLRTYTDKVLEMAATKAAAPDAITIETVAPNMATQIFADNPFKLEELKARSADEHIRIAKHGRLVDIVPPNITPCTNAASIKSFKVNDKSAATWKPLHKTARELPTQQALIRLMGISFTEKDALEKHEAAQREARQYDHRKIGQSQQLFFTHDSSPGTPFILPHGMRIASKIQRVIRDLYQHWGYDEVLTPQLYKAELWKRSGHWENYRDDMFAVEGFKEMQERAQSFSHTESEHRSCCGDHAHAEARAVDLGDDSTDNSAAYGLKPMNCPGHCLLFAAQEHSYRDLPIRYAEFSPLHRNEASGALTGLTRVRRFHQDDAHVFCRLDQVFGEIASMLTMLRQAYEVFGYENFELVLSTRPPSFLGEVKEWDEAEEALRNALESSGLSWSMNEGDGAFYGPKIDIRLVDASGKRHQTATIQLDFQLPRRFDLRYTNADGTSSPPVMIHRAILGSVERFMAILTETSRGDWPFWLNPRQAVVLPVQTDDAEVLAYAQKVRETLALGTEPKSGQTPEPASMAVDKDVLGRQSQRASHTFHVEVDASNESLGKRLVLAQRSRASFVLFVGREEAEKGTVQVRFRDGIQAKRGDPVAVPAIADLTKTSLRPQLPRDMGRIPLRDLRDSFVHMDDHHW